jgi:hypothetical protein
LSELGPTVKRCVTLRVKPVRHWPFRAVIAADRTSRSGALSVWWALGNGRNMGNGKRTSVVRATKYAGEYHCGIRGIKLSSIS